MLKPSSYQGRFLTIKLDIDKLACQFQAQDGINNPYRKLSVFALDYPVLLYTIISCASEYMRMSGYLPTNVAIEHNARAIRSIRQELTQCSSFSAKTSGPEPSTILGITGHQALLAAILLQVAVVSFSGSTSAQGHLSCAFYILNELGYLEKPVQDFIPRLLVQRFAWLDLAISIYHRRRPRVAVDCWFAHTDPDDHFDNTEPSFREMTGCPHTVFTYLLRLAHMAADASERSLSSQAECDFYDEATELENSLHTHETSLEHTRKYLEDEHFNAIARCFTWIAILLIQRRVFLDISTSPRVQRSMRKIFKFMNVVPLHSGAHSASSMPFFLAAREARDLEDQQWVRQKHQELIKLYLNPARPVLFALAERLWESAETGGDKNGNVEKLERECEAYIF